MTHCSSNWKCLQCYLNNHFPALIRTASVKVKKRCRQIWQGPGVQSSLTMQSSLCCFILSFWYMMYFASCFDTVVQNASSASPLHLARRKTQTRKFQVSNSVVTPTNMSGNLGNYRVLLKITSLISLQVLLCCKVLSTVPIRFGEMWHGVEANKTGHSVSLYIFILK